MQNLFCLPIKLIFIYDQTSMSNSETVSLIKYKDQKMRIASLARGSLSAF